MKQSKHLVPQPVEGALELSLSPEKKSSVSVRLTLQSPHSEGDEMENCQKQKKLVVQILKEKKIVKTDLLQTETC